MRKIQYALLCLLIACLLLGGCGANSEEYSAPAELESSIHGEGRDTQVFVPDWERGNENFYGYGQNEAWNRSERYRNYVVQDSWLYYASEKKIYKMPLGGGADDVQTIVDLGYVKADYRTINISVVKDWIYFLWFDNDDDTDGIYRVRTDGSMMTRLLDQKEACLFTNGNVYYVADDKVYFIAQEHKGAQTIVYRLAELDTETDEISYISEGSDEYMNLFAGYEDTLYVYMDGSRKKIDLEGNVILDFSDNEYAWNGYYDIPFLMSIQILVREDDLEEIEERELVFENLYVDYSGFTTMYQSWWFDAGNECTGGMERISAYGEPYIDLESGGGVYVYEGHYPRFSYPQDNYGDSITGLYVYNIRPRPEIPYEEVKLNNDRVSNIIVMDGQIYYRLTSIPEGAVEVYGDRNPQRVLYRINYDGTGFEEIGWMYP